jgi:hypothetical protein
LAIYAATRGGDTPIHNKDGLVEELQGALAAAQAFCTEAGMDVDTITATEKLAHLKLIADAVETLIARMSGVVSSSDWPGLRRGADKALLPVGERRPT